MRKSDQTVSREHKICLFPFSVCDQIVGKGRISVQKHPTLYLIIYMPTKINSTGM